MRYLFLFFISVCSLFFLTNKIRAQAPTITSFSPSSGTIGTLVTITGTNLNNIDTIKIGGVSAIKISSTSTNLVAMVMPNTVTGNIIVSNVFGSIISNTNFTINNDNSLYSQQGNKLVGTGNIGNAQQGRGVCLSADGKTAIVSGPGDSIGYGAVWIYTRTGNIWTQQGNKLVGTGYGSQINQGYSVSISADGNTAIIGAPYDSNEVGAAWIFTRTGNTWTQQGNKLVGTDCLGLQIWQGYSVSLSADGNTAIIGGPKDNSLGAAWIFTRTGNTWTQQGNKLKGTGYFEEALAVQGSSVSLSADGNTAIIGGISDSFGRGAAWIFTRSGTTWIQQGNKLVGTGYIGSTVYQGSSVSISADGNTAIIGGPIDSNMVGAAWIFTRTGNTWTQQGNKLVGTSGVGITRQGCSVSLNSKGNIAIVGGYYDSNLKGAIWIYTRTGNTWTQQGNKLVGNGSVGSSVYQGFSLGISADGNTIIAGGFGDNNSNGAAWIYTKSKISIIGSLSIFEKCSGFNSNVQSISITGMDVLSNFTIAAPTGFEISRNPFTNYSSNIVLTPLSGVIDTTIIYIRLTTLASGNISGNIICSNNESTINIPVIGTSNINTRTFIKDFKITQCLKNNKFLFKDSSIYCGSINRQWFINNSLISIDSSFQYSFTNAGVYSLKLLVTNINGEKDSVTKTITVYPSPNLSITASQTSICKGQGQSVKLTGSGALNYTWTNGVINDVFFVPDTTKNYQFIGSNSYGCFDTANIAIAVNPMPIIITTLDKTKITTYQFGASFQWYDCDTKSPIVSATNQIYTATKNGNYAVIVNLNNCIDTSDCIAVLSLGQQEINHESDYTIYPNPNNGSFTIKLINVSSLENKITIVDMLGRIVYQSEIVSKQNSDNIIVPPLNLMDGLYTIIINSNNGNAFRKPLIVKNSN